MTVHGTSIVFVENYRSQVTLDTTSVPDTLFHVTMDDTGLLDPHSTSVSSVTGRLWFSHRRVRRRTETVPLPRSQDSGFDRRDGGREFLLTVETARVRGRRNGLFVCLFLLNIKK